MTTPDTTSGISALESWPNLSTDSPGGDAGRWDQFNGDTATNIWFLCITVVLGISGTVGNLMVIGAVLVYGPLRRLPNAFIVNLACADLCVSGVIQLVTVYAVLSHGALFMDHGPALCNFFGALCTTSCTCSLWSITAISINRYVCICHHSMYYRIYAPRLKVAAMIAALWVGCFLLDLPALLGWGGHAYDPKVMFCTFNYTASLSYTIFLVSAGVGVPVLIVSYCYTRILLFVRASSQTLRRLSEGNNDQFMALGRETRGIKKRDMALLRTVGTLWVVFLIMWAPYTVYVLFDTRNTWNRTLYVLFVNLCHANSSINCVIYAATNPTFRRGYMAFLRCLLWRKSAVLAQKQSSNYRIVSRVDGREMRPPFSCSSS